MSIKGSSNLKVAQTSVRKAHIKRNPLKILATARCWTFCMNFTLVDTWHVCLLFMNSGWERSARLLTLQTNACVWELSCIPLIFFFRSQTRLFQKAVSSSKGTSVIHLETKGYSIVFCYSRQFSLSVLKLQKDFLKLKNIVLLLQNLWIEDLIKFWQRMKNSTVMTHRKQVLARWVLP